MVTTLSLPTNGALMTTEQADALEKYVRSAGTEIERAMLHQMQIMVHGATAHRRLLENEHTCRMTAEAEARDLRLEVKRLERAQVRCTEAEEAEAALLVSLRNVQTFMQSLPKKPKLADYKTLVEQMRAEIETALSEKGEEE